MYDDEEAADRVNRRLLAERFGANPWWTHEEPRPRFDDSEITTARRRRILEQASGDEEEQVKHG